MSLQETGLRQELLTVCQVWRRLPATQRLGELRQESKQIGGQPELHADLVSKYIHTFIYVHVDNKDKVSLK